MNSIQLRLIESPVSRAPISNSSSDQTIPIYTRKNQILSQKRNIMEFKIILSDREISLDLALYTTLALFVIVLLAVFFWIFMTCQNWSDPGRNSRRRNTVDYYPVHIGRRHCTLLDYQKYAYPQNMQSFQNSAYKKYSMKVNRNPSKSSSKYNTNSTVCELPIVEV